MTLSEMKHDHFQITQQDNLTIARLTEAELSDDNIAKAMADELARYVRDSEPARLVVDFGEVDIFRDITAAGLLGVEKTMRSYGGELRLAGMRSHVREVFQLFGLDRVLAILDSVDEAVESLHRDGG